MSNPEDRKNAARATEFPLDKADMYPSQKRRFEEVGEGMAIGMVLFALQDKAKLITQVSQSLIMLSVTLAIALGYGGVF